MATISEPPAVTPTSGSSVSSGWTLANPAPLGLMGFGLTTLVLSFVNSNLVGGGALSFPIVLGMALAFGGVAQLLAGMWEFRNGNTFGAVAFSSFGAFWISFYILVSVNVSTLIKTNLHELNSLLGLYLWMWGIFTGIMFLCTFKSPRALQLLFLLLTVTFILLGIGNSGASSSMIHAGGYVGIATGAVALYIACADIMKEAYGRSVLPVG